MYISKLQAGQSGPAPDIPGGVAAATAMLHDVSGAASLPQQIAAYQSLSGAWREGGPAARTALAPSLTESPFAQRVQATLNAFTRAAWAGPDAAPPAPQARILAAFDALPAEDREIVAAMQADRSGRPKFADAEAYRASLQAELDAAQPQARRDSITLSKDAQAYLDRGTEPPPVAPAVGRTRADLAAAVAAYARSVG